MGLARGVLQLALARLLVIVALAVGVVELGAQGGDFILGRDGEVDVGFDVPLLAALGDLVAFVPEYARVQHDGQGKHRGRGPAIAASAPGRPRSRAQKGLHPAPGCG